MKFKAYIILFCMAFLFILPTFAANTASQELSLNFNEYIDIKTLTSDVLVANITDKTGNLYTPLSSKFRVISNCSEQKTLYLKAESLTESGKESAMFSIGDRVFIAFANVNKPPKNEALINCKMLTDSKYSPGVVAYPVTSIIGAKNEYMGAKGKYKIFIGNGTTDITVNVGSHVLKNSFDSNDAMGFYQATLSLTEFDI